MEMEVLRGLAQAGASWAGQVGFPGLAPISQPEMKPVSWSLFLGISGDGPGAIAASSHPRGTGASGLK